MSATGLLRVTPQTVDVTGEEHLERLFAEALPDIEAVCRSVGRRYRMRDAELDDLVSAVTLSILTSHYRVLARFEGRCSLRTYLRTVVHRLHLDARRKEFGKWRASARATRQGPLAMTLERLIYRDGLSRAEALEHVALNHSPAVSREALDELVSRLPVRRPRPSVVSEPADFASLPSARDTPEDALARETSVALAQSAIDSALSGLSERDLLLLRLRFEDNLTTADMARILGVRARHLYRRMESTLGEVRSRMKERGVTWAEVAGLVEEGSGGLQIRWPAA